MAEALRAYLENPNYMKSRYPAVAARLRSYVNKSPRLSPHIQLNANAPTGSLPGLFAQTQDDSENPALVEYLRAIGLY